jgi:hypothetical protein
VSGRLSSPSPPSGATYVKLKLKSNLGNKSINIEGILRIEATVHELKLLKIVGSLLVAFAINKKSLLK